MASLSDLDTTDLPSPSEPLDPQPPRPFSSLVEVDAAGLSHVGKVRANNEDHFQIVQTNRSLKLLMTNLPQGQVPEYFEDIGYSFVVADGMGGAQAGEVASMMAIVIGTNLQLNAANWSLKINQHEARELMERASRMIHKIDEILVKKTDSDQSLRGMGTTLTTCYSVGDDLFVFHVGDSRAYLYRDNTLRRLTHDHTLAQDLADMGEISHADVPTHRLRHVLTNVLGSSANDVHVDMAQLKLRHGDRILLCTDGLTEMVDDPALSTILEAAQSAQQSCESLVQKALENGGRDNVTAVMAYYNIPPVS